jgi:hypothetical protein
MIIYQSGCCENRGIMAHSSLTQTTVLKGRFNDDYGTKKEFFRQHQAATGICTKMTLSSNSSISGHTAQGSASSGPQWKSLTDSKSDMVIKIGGDGDLVFEANSVRLGENTENLEDRIQRLEHVLGATGRKP